MVTAAEMRTDVDNILQNGEVVRFRYFNISGATANYDDDVTLTQSGSDIYTSGLIQPINDPTSSFEARLVQEGRLTTNDFRLYINGTVQTSGLLKVSIGSPTFVNSYALLDDGVQNWTIGQESVYKKLLLRFLTNGSLQGE